MYRKLIAAVFVLGFAGTPASSQMGCCTNSTTSVVSSNSCCVYTLSSSPSETKQPLTPREKLKVERDSYQRQLDADVKSRDYYNKAIDDRSVQIKGYDDAIEKLNK